MSIDDFKNSKEAELLTDKLAAQPSEAAGGSAGHDEAFERWWASGVHKWNPDSKMAEYELARQAWLAAAHAGEVLAGQDGGTLSELIANSLGAAEMLSGPARDAVPVIKKVLAAQPLTPNAGEVRLPSDITDFLVSAASFLRSCDNMNATLHLADVRLSPLTQKAMELVDRYKIGPQPALAASAPAQATDRETAWKSSPPRKCVCGHGPGAHYESSPSCWCGCNSFQLAGAAKEAGGERDYELRTECENCDADMRGRNAVCLDCWNRVAPLAAAPSTRETELREALENVRRGLFPIRKLFEKRKMRLGIEFTDSLISGIEERLAADKPQPPSEMK